MVMMILLKIIRCSKIIIPQCPPLLVPLLVAAVATEATEATEATVAAVAAVAAVSEEHGWHVPLVVQHAFVFFLMHFSTPPMSSSPLG